MFKEEHLQQISEYVNQIKFDVFDSDKLDRIVDRIEFLKIPQGIWNFNYLVRVNNRKLVFKLYPPTEGLFFKNSGAGEFKALKLFEHQNLDIAPKPILFDDKCTILEYPVLIYEYIEGKNLHFCDHNVKEVARAFAKLHNLNILDLVNTGALDFLEERREDSNSLINRIEIIWDEYQKKYGQTSPDFSLFADFVAKVKKISQKNLTKNNLIFAYPKSIIHTDPVPGNFIVNGDKLTIIDWQNPTIGDPSFDICLFLSEAFNLWDSEHTLTQKQKQIFLQEYLQLRDDSTLKARMEAKSVFYLLEFALHCLLRYSDYSTNNLPREITNSQETQSEKYQSEKHQFEKHQFEKYRKAKEIANEFLRNNLFPDYC